MSPYFQNLNVANFVNKNSSITIYFKQISQCVFFPAFLQFHGKRHRGFAQDTIRHFLNTPVTKVLGSYILKPKITSTIMDGMVLVKLFS